MTFRAVGLTICLGASLITTAHAEMVAATQHAAAPHPFWNPGPMNLAPQAADPLPPLKVPLDEPNLGADRGGEDEVKKWMTACSGASVPPPCGAFDLVVVIDKNSKLETLTAYRNVGDASAPILDKAIDHTTVSTGLEDRTCHTVTSMTTGQVENVVPIWRHTPTGYYVPKLLDVDHYSRTYDASHMRFAVGWDSDDGYYTHEAPAHSFNFLGHRASHGCIRMHTADAQDLFTMALMTGGPFNQNIDQGLRAKCPEDPDQPNVKCVPDPKVEAGLLAYFNKVQQQIFPENKDPKKGPLHDLKSHLPRLKPYDQTPEVPVISKSGDFEIDPATHQIKTQPGYRTLYIIKNSDNPTTVLPRLVKVGNTVVNTAVPVPPAPNCPTVEQAAAAAGQQQQQPSSDPIGDFFRNAFGQH